jgi:PKD repeat protein
MTYFTNTTISEEPITYAWDFGDGATSTEENPTHTYGSPGLYTVVLTATNAAGSGVTTNTVTVYSSPAADFVHSGPDWLGQTTHFTNATTTTPAGDSTVNYRWDFGDGNSSALETPTHDYSDSGTYTVVLTATNAAGSDVATDTVNIYSAPSVTFTTSTPGWLGESTDFTATVTTTPMGDSSVNLTWDFGDGTVRTGSTNTSHTYADSGTYTVILTATNAAGTDVATKAMTIHGPPTADFTTSSPDWLGQMTYFTNTTISEEPITYAWDFGDGATSTQESLTHAYGSPGIHTVTLTSTNPAGSDVVTNTVTVYGEPAVDFAASPAEGFYPLNVTFTSTVTTAPPGDPTLTYLWRFGDGKTSTQPNPSHTYDAADTYTVSLTVSNAAGSETLTGAEHIVVYEPVQAQFTAAPRQAIATATVQFTDTSTGPVAAWTWDFGDGENSTRQHPTHTYEAAGVYTISLAAQAAGDSALWSGGTDMVTRTNYVIVHEAVIADFTAAPVSGTLPLEVNFTNESTGSYTETLWHFGDGVTSTLESPTHTYTSAGTYTVTLDVSGPGGSDMLTEESYITVDEHFDVFLPMVLRRH